MSIDSLRLVELLKKVERGLAAFLDTFDVDDPLDNEDWDTSVLHPDDVKEAEGLLRKIGLSPSADRLTRKHFGLMARFAHMGLSQIEHDRGPKAATSPESREAEQDRTYILLGNAERLRDFVRELLSAMETHDASPTAIGDSNAAMKLAPTVAETHHTSSSALHERDMRILRKLAQHHPMAILPVDIGAGSRNTVANRLKDLHKRGLVEQTNGPRGGWGLTSKGLDMTVSKPSTK